MKIVILGLSITSSWGNGHATTYRCLVGGLVNEDIASCSSRETNHGMRHIGIFQYPGL